MERICRGEIMREVKKQLCLAGPLFVVNLLQFSLRPISVMFVGHLGELALSIASVAISFATVTGFYSQMGMASGLDTLCGQSYGAELYHMLGFHLQRAMLVLSIVSIFLAVIWANTKYILIAAGQNAIISEEAGKFITFMIPSLFAYGPLQCLVRFLQAQKKGLSNAAMLCNYNCSPCYLVLDFGDKIDIGSQRSCLGKFSLSLVKFIDVSALCQVLFFLCQDLDGFFKGGYAKPLRFPPNFHSFRSHVVVQGLLETSVLTICLNTATVVWTIYFGFSGAVSTRVSHELGAGQPQAARLAANVVIFLAIIEGSVLGVVLLLLKNVWGHAFSNEKEVVKYVGAMMPILAANSLLDAIQTVLTGVARGCGRQKLWTWINLGTIYFLGIPAAILLAFALHLKAKGLWLGMVAAFFTQALIFLIITIRTDWKKQANKAAKRVDASKIPGAARPQG
ncbi:hypothetical protein SLA2020_331440 [Shorea laevis]